jgi:hypothetical protein
MAVDIPPLHLHQLEVIVSRLESLPSPNQITSITLLFASLDGKCHTLLVPRQFASAIDEHGGTYIRGGARSYYVCYCAPLLPFYRHSHSSFLLVMHTHHWPCHLHRGAMYVTTVNTATSRNAEKRRGAGRKTAGY